MNRSTDIQISPIDLSRHIGMCVSFLQDSFRCSFGTADIWHRTFGKEGERYVSWLQTYPGLMFHAWQEDRIVGELMLDVRAAYLQHLYVIPTLRCTGIGSALHAHFVRLVSKGEWDKATVKVSRSNAAAVRFYERSNWRRVGVDDRDAKLDVYELVLRAF